MCVGTGQYHTAQFGKKVLTVRVRKGDMLKFGKLFPRVEDEWKKLPKREHIPLYVPTSYGETLFSPEKFFKWFKLGTIHLSLT